MPRAWYAVHTIAGHENKVKDVLTRRAQVEGYWNIDIYEILIPTEQELTTRSGKRVLVDKKVFPGYILVQMALTDDTYKLVKSTSGVTGFVQSAPVLIFTRVLLGIAECAYLPAAIALIAEHHEPDTRGTAMGLHISGMQTGLIAGSTVAGYLGQQFGWRVDFFVLGGMDAPAR